MKGETSSRKLHIPLGTRLVLITDHTNGVWRIWTGINDKNIPVHKALGTFIELHPNGEAYMTTIRTDSENIAQVMEAKNE